MRQFLHELLFAPSGWAVVTCAKRVVWLLVAYILGLGSYAAGWAVADAQGVSGTGVGLFILSSSMGLAGLYVAFTTDPGDRIRVTRERRTVSLGFAAGSERVDPTFAEVPVPADGNADPYEVHAAEGSGEPAREVSERRAA